MVKLKPLKVIFMKKESPRIAFAIIASFVFTFNSSLFAASETWQGGAGSWNGTNWGPTGGPAGSTAPGSIATTTNTDTATFNTASAGTVTVDASRNIDNIVFDGSAGAFTLNGGPLLLTSGGSIKLGTSATSFSGTGTTETISAPIFLEGGYTFQNNSTTASNTLSFTGPILNATNGNVTLTLNGANTGANTISGAIGNGGAAIGITTGGSANWILSSANTFAGATTIGSGTTLQLNNSASLQNSAVSIGAVNGLKFNTGLGTASMAGLAGSSNEQLQDGATNSGGAITLDLGQYFGSGNSSYSGVLSGTGGIVKFGTSTQTFSGANTYSGGTTVNAGTLASTLSTTSTTPFGTGAMTLNGNGILSFAPSTASSTPSFAIADAAPGTLLSYSGGNILKLTKATGGSLTVTAGDGGAVLNRTGNGVLILQTSANDLGSGENFFINGTAPTTTGPAGSVNASIVGLNANLVSGTLTNATSSTSTKVVNVTSTTLPDYLVVGSALLGTTVTSITGSAGAWVVNLNADANATLTGASTAFTTSGQADFLTYNGSGFVSDNAAYTSLDGTIAAGTTTVSQIGNVANAGAPATFSGNNTVGGLVVQRGVTATINSGVILTVGSNMAGTQAGIILNGGTIGGSTGTLNFGASEGIVYDFVAGATINSIITGTGGLTLAGNQTIQLGTSTGALSTFSGGLNLEGVTLNLAFSNSSANGTAVLLNGLGDPTNTITANGATITMSGSEYAARNFVLGPGGLTIGTNGFNFSGTGGITVTGGNNAGYTSLNGVNTFTGGININGGLLAVESETEIGGSSQVLTFGTGGSFSGISIIGNSLQSLSNTLVFSNNTNPVAFDIQSATNTFTLSQALNDGSTGFTKFGAGTLVLTGASDYSGATTVYGGTLELNGATGSLSSLSSLVLDGGTFELLGAGSGSTTVQTFNNVTTGVKINNAGITSGGAIVVNANGGTATLNLGSLPQGTSVVIPGAAIQLELIGSGASMTTTTAPDGTGGNAGIYGGRIVVTNSSGVTDWASSSATTGTGLNIIFNYTGYVDYSSTATYTNASSGDYNTTSTDNIQFLGASAGTQPINIVSPAGGNTTVNSLKINANGGSFDVGVGGTFTVTSGGILYTGSGALTILDGTLYSGLTASNGLIGSNIATPAPSSDLIVQQYGTGTLTISSVIADGGINQASTFTKAGPGTLVLSGINTYTGYTFVDGGVLSVASGANLGEANGTLSNITVTAGATSFTTTAALPTGFGVGSQILGNTGTGFTNTVTGISFSGGVYTVTLQSGASTSLSNGTANWITAQGIELNGGTLDVTGNIVTQSNSGGATPATSGNASIFLGGAGGEVNLLNGAIWGAGTQGIKVASYTNGGGAGYASFTVDSSDGSNGQFYLSASMQGSLTINGGTVITTGYNNGLVSNGTPLYFGSGTENSIVTNPTLLIQGAYVYVGDLVSPTTSNAKINGNGTSFLVVTDPDGVTDSFSGTLVDTSGTFGFVKAGAGTQDLTNTNSSYVGVTRIDAGILNVGGLANGGTDSSIGAATAVAGNLLFGGLSSEAAILQYTGATATSTNRLFTIGDSDGTGTYMGNAATLDASGSTANATMSFTGTGAIAFGNDAFVHSLTLTGTNTGSTTAMNTFAPLLGDSTLPTSLIKSGAGSWAVTNANTYSGGTSVTGGTLYANNTTGSATGSGAVSVSGGTLAGTGFIAPTIATGSAYGVTVTAGGSITPGGVQPAANFNPNPVNLANGSLTLNSTGIASGNLLSAVNGTTSSPAFNFALGSSGSSSQIIVAAGTTSNVINFNVGGTSGPGGTSSVVSINDLVGASLTLDQTYILFAGNGHTMFEDDGETLLAAGDLGAVTANGQLITGGLSLLAANTVGNFFSNWYGSSELFLTSNDDIVVEVIPEPGTWAMMLGGFAILIVLQRRKRKQG